MYDGIRLGRAAAFPFRHNDFGHLEKRLQRCTATGDRFICIESIYSTDGSTAPLKEITALAKQYDAHLIVDEAHAVAVCGPEGRGLAAAHEVIPDLFAQVVTFGKGVGVHGAIVLGNTTLKQALLNFATSYIYTTALPLHALAAIKCSYDLFPKMDEARQQLQTYIDLFSSSGVAYSSTHIQSLPVRGNAAVKAVAEKLVKEGFDVRALVSPTVQRGEEKLRICLHAFNSKEEVQKLIFLLQHYQEACYA
jgi:8-amino-7-oxononanoate synthase